MKDIAQGLLLTKEPDIPPKDILVDNIGAFVLAYVDLDNPSEPEDSPNLEYNSSNIEESEDNPIHLNLSQAQMLLPPPPKWQYPACI